HGRFGDSAEMHQGVADLPLLEPALRLVVQLLEPAPAAALDVWAGRLYPIVGPGLQGFAAGLAIAGAQLAYPSTDTVARQPAVDHHHPALVPGESLSAEREVGDVQG